MDDPENCKKIKLKLWKYYHLEWSSWIGEMTPKHRLIFRGRQFCLGQQSELHWKTEPRSRGPSTDLVPVLATCYKQINNNKKGF